MEQLPSIQEGPLFRFLIEQIHQRLSEREADDLIRRLRWLRHWGWEVELVPRYRRGFYDRIAFAVLFAFLASFAAARTFAYLVTFKHIPYIFLNIKGVHVHHFTYGFVVLAVAGFLSLVSFSAKNKLWLALLYGMGLGLAADETGQWLRLQDDYWVRQSYDAIIIISLILLFIIYLPRYLNLFNRRASKALHEPSTPQQHIHGSDGSSIP